MGHLPCPTSRCALCPILRPRLRQPTNLFSLKSSESILSKEAEAGISEAGWSGRGRNWPPGQPCFAHESGRRTSTDLPDYCSHVIRANGIQAVPSPLDLVTPANGWTGQLRGQTTMLAGAPQTFLVCFAELSWRACATHPSLPPSSMCWMAKPPLVSMPTPKNSSGWRQSSCRNE